MRHKPDIIAEKIDPQQNNSWIVQQLLREDDEPAVDMASHLGARFIELDNVGNNVMAAWGSTDLMRKVGRDAARMDVAWTKEMAPLNVNWRGERLHSILYTALTRTTPNLEMVKLLVMEYKLNPEELFSTGSYNPAQNFVHLISRPSHWWQTDALEFLLKNGADIEALNANQETPLLYALKEPHSDAYTSARIRAVEILLLHGANPNATNDDGLTCLNIAARQPKCIELLLKNGASPSIGLRPFIFDVIKEQDLDTLQFIADSEADVNARCQPSSEREVNDNNGNRISGNKGKKRSFPALFKISDLDKLCKTAYPIHVAASQSFNTAEKKEKAIRIVKLLLGAGADPLMAYDDGTKIMHSLAEQGGILEPFFDDPRFDTELRDHKGRTLLLAACDSTVLPSDTSNDSLLFRLLDRGASLCATDQDGRNALHCLVSAPCENLEQKIRRSSLEPVFLKALTSTPDNKGRTPLHYALAASRFELIDALISHGANPSASDPMNGTTALHHLAPGLLSWEDIIIHDPSPMLTPEIRPLIFAELGSDSPSLDSILQYIRTKYLTSEVYDRAAQHSPRRHIATLLARGLDINARDHVNETPLFKLVSSQLEDPDDYELGAGILPALRVFEGTGVNFQARNNIGESVLHNLAGNICKTAWWRRKEEVDPVKEDLKISFRWLREQGVDVAWEDNKGRTCLDVAAATGADWMLELCKRK